MLTVSGLSCFSLIFWWFFDEKIVTKDFQKMNGMIYAVIVEDNKNKIT